MLEEPEVREEASLLDGTRLDLTPFRNTRN
jgi:hypothetical protein